MYVRARLEQGVSEAAISVPQQAIVRNNEGASVLIVGADNKVVSQPVTATANDGQNWVVSAGLKGGERIVVEGFQKAKPGATVNPQPWKGPAGSAAPAPAAAPAATK
jgi:membrane fusion protein (multidrug efflux system)